MKLKSTAIQFTVFAAFFLLPFLTHAQPGFDDNVSDVPIDGGLSLLVAAGVGYGVKKMKKKDIK